MKDGRRDAGHRPLLRLWTLVAYMSCELLQHFPTALHVFQTPLASSRPATHVASTCEFRSEGDGAIGLTWKYHGILQI